MFTRRSFLPVAASLIFAATPTTRAWGDKLPPPDQPGQYGAAATTFAATMTGGRVALVQVFYPTLAAPDCSTKYTISSPAGPYRVSSPLCAVLDAAPAPGPFPLIVYDHGGGGPGADSQRVAQSPSHELLATHGFVVAVAIHSGDALVRVRDLPLVRAHVLAHAATPGDRLFGAIDGSRIGLSGFSAGGGAAVGSAGGWAAQGVLPDGGWKALLAYEPGLRSTLSDAANITIPMMIFGGSQFASAFVMPDLFAAATSATPRVYVRSEGALHFNYNTSLCPFIEETRETAIAANPSLPEPLTTLTASNAAAAAAWNNWNIGEVQLALLGIGFGGGRNICDRLGVSSARSLDVSPEDGFTDAPPFYLTDPATRGPAPSADVMAPVIHTFTVAFWKVFLAGDGRYMRFIAPGYAQHTGLHADVTIAD